MKKRRNSGNCLRQMMLSLLEGGWSRRRREEMKTNSTLKDICDHCEHLQRECDIFIGYLLHKLYIGLRAALSWVAPSVSYYYKLSGIFFRYRDEEFYQS